MTYMYALMVIGLDVKSMLSAPAVSNIWTLATDVVIVVSSSSSTYEKDKYATIMAKNTKGNLLGNNNSLSI